MQVLCAEHLSLSMSSGPSLHGFQQSFAKPAHSRGLGRGGKGVSCGEGTWRLSGDRSASNWKGLMQSNLKRLGSWCILGTIWTIEGENNKQRRPEPATWN